jgi:hypothetical protein
MRIHLHSIRRIGAALGLSLCLRAFGADPAAPLTDVFSDTWSATDALGRSLPAFKETGGARANKFVGLFYFLWLGRHGEAGPFDISSIVKANPSAIDDPNNPHWGPLYVPHHWGKPLFDYYVSDDEWVLQKHAQMLADAGVDAVIFDVTNQLTYPESWRALCRAFDRSRRLGNRVPQIAFLCPFGDPRKVVLELYSELYAKNICPELWFRWEGKPLILADPAALDASSPAGKAALECFTFRKPQPDYFTGPTGPKQWGWLEVAPQHVFHREPGQPEQMTVGVAQNAVDGRLSVLSNPRSHGRSFHDGKEPGPEGRDTSGRNFAEQWERALRIDPPFLFVTGWNEWIAGRFDSKAPFYQPGPVAFVDQFNQEFSRDIEPMEGGHGDNYYYQLIANIRRFKGVRELEPVSGKIMNIDGCFDDWADVRPEYRDTAGDTLDRDYRGWGQGTRLVNKTGRNDILSAKVSIDRRSVYFQVRTREPLTSCADSNWMLLFIDADANPATGWLGYDFVVNRKGAVQGHAMLEKFKGNGRWETVARVRSRHDGCQIELAVSRKALGLAKSNATFDFKWADNILMSGEWSDFTLYGDAAPNDRHNYRARIAEIRR